MVRHTGKSRVKGQIKPFLIDNSSFLQLRGVQEAVCVLQAWFVNTAYPSALMSFEDFIELKACMAGLSYSDL